MLTFGMLLDQAGIKRSDVRLLRHQDNRYSGRYTPFAMWRDDRARFEAYQELQALGDAPKLRAPYWASFVGVPERETLFVGLYSAELLGLLPSDHPHPITGATEIAGSCHIYKLDLNPHLAEFAGRLWIEWGSGYRAWI